MNKKDTDQSGSNDKAFKSGIWYTVSNFLVKGIAFLTTPIFTRLLTKTDFGLYNNYASWLAIATIFVTLNLESTLISARYDYEQEFDEYIFSVLSLSTLSTTVWFVVVNVFSEAFISFLGMDIVYINIMLTYLLFFPAVTLFQARERYLFEYKKTVALSLFIAVGTASISVVLTANMQNKLAGRIIGSIIPTVAVGFLLYLYFIRKGKRIVLGYWKYALPICLPFIPHLLSLTLLNSIDRVMITRWCGAEDNAIYSLAYTCGSMVTMLLTSINSAFAPWLGEKLNARSYDEIRKFSKVYILGFCFLAIGIMAVAPEILLILGGKTYSEAKFVMPPIAMGCICQFIYTMYVNIEQFKRKTVGMAFASMIAAIVNLVLNYILIPKVGYLVAAYTTLVGYLVLLVIHMFLVYRLKLNDIYDYKMIIVTIFVMLGITVLINAIYPLNVIRYMLIGVYVIILIKLFIQNKNQLYKILKRR